MDFIKQIKAKVKNKKTYTQQDVIEILGSVEQSLHNVINSDSGALPVGKIYKPDKIAKYDVILSRVCGVVHPSVVYKVDDKFVYTVTLTSTPKEAVTLFKIKKSRCYNKGYMGNIIVRYTHEEAIKQWIGIYDNLEEADEMFAVLEDYYKTLIRI